MTGGEQRARDFRTELKVATDSRDVETRLAKLTNLAAAGPSYLETIQIDRALGALAPEAQTTHTRVRLAILGDSTLDHLAPAIRVAGLRRNLLIDVHLGKFGQYRQELLEGDRALDAFRPTMLLFALTAEELLADVPLLAQRETADRRVREAVQGLRELWQKAHARFGATVIQQSFLDVTTPLFGNHERFIPGAPARLVARLNDGVADAAAAHGTLLLDVAAASARDGLDAWFDPRHWLQGKLQISPAAAARYGSLLSCLIGAVLGRSRKCLVLDLDDTLWGGVLGDDGIDGVVLGQGSALGEAHLALQKYAKQLKERGVVLGVCSKNDWRNVEQMFDTHPEMWLRRSDIAAFAVNWSDKAKNLQALAERLNLGLDSMVFVDDNPSERARVRESLPMVAVPELPEDPAGYIAAIARGGYFEATGLTSEDQDRAAQYAANSEREALLNSSSGMDDFLRGLEMSVVHDVVGAVDYSRALQLINKTNQFNMTTQRLTPEQLKEWAASPSDMVLQFRLADRFGDNGLVSVMLFRRDAGATDKMHLANWVMSCRVFGRQLEHEAMNVAVERAREKGIRMFSAEFVPSAKNGVVSDLFGRLGFTEIAPEVRAGQGGVGWMLDLAAYAPHATHIDRKVTEP